MVAEKQNVLFVGETWGHAFPQIVSSYTGEEQSKIRVEHDWHSQVKATKGNVTLMGLPEEFGRMPAYRQRAAAYAEASAFVIVVNNTNNKPDWTYTMDQIKKNKGEGKPVLVLGTCTDAKDESNYAQIAKAASAINAKYEFINETKLKSCDKNEEQKLERIINAHINLIAPATPTPTPGEEEENPVVAAKDNKEIEAKQQGTWKRLISFIGNKVTNGNQTTAA